MKKLPDMQLNNTTVKQYEKQLEDSSREKHHFGKSLMLAVGGIVLSAMFIALGFAARYGYEQFLGSDVEGTTRSTGSSDSSQREFGTEIEVQAADDGTASSKPVSAEASLYRDVYILYGSVTVDLPMSLVRSFFDEECPVVGACESSIPCVNAQAVNAYVDLHLVRTLDAESTLKTAKNENGHFLYRVSDFAPDGERLKDDIIAVLEKRTGLMREKVCGDTSENDSGMGDLNEISSEVRGMGVEVPGTDGLFAPFYLEIDDSQQHLYIWRDGALAADYEVSGFYDEYAVYGVFKIHNKSENAWSPIAEKWMPYWMAYYYDASQAAWLGIHELVWWTDDSGEYVEESSESIGQKKSGGCIRLDRGQAEELYNMVEVDMPVLIHP